METNFFLVQKEAELFRFKSYYVVWKRTAYFVAGLCFAKFKSYYVVWKLGEGTPIKLKQK